MSNNDTLWSDEEWRAAMSTAEINDLKDSAFAHIEAGGEKDEEGKTTPRSLRHYPIHDKPHADNALARANGVLGNDEASEGDKAIATAALPKIKKAVAKFADDKEAKAARWETEHRDGMSYGDLSDLLEEALSIKFCGKDEYCWVVDFTDTTVIYSINGETKQVDYSVEGDDTVTFTGQPIAVTSKTEWVPTMVNVQSNSARSARPVIKKPRHRTGPATGVEVRHYAAAGLELRDDGSNNLQLVGMPIVYDTPYSVRDMFGTFQETMKPGVVTDLLKNGTDTRFLFNHGGLPLSRTISGTLKLEDSTLGLRCIANLDARQQLATDLAVAVERGDVTQMSVGMIVGEDKWDERQENREIFKLKALEDVSAVTYPASPTTDIAIAQRMLYEMPVESRERVRRMWAITRDLHDDRAVTKEDIDLLSDGLRALAEADEVIDETRDESTVQENNEEIDESRAAPTPNDKGIMSKIKAAHQATVDALHAQANDPDMATDPVDADVMSSLQNAHKALSKAIGVQAIDGAPDIPPGTLAGDDGTLGGAGVSDATVASDGTGVSARKRMTTEELRRGAQRDIELARIERARREREKRNKS